MRSTPKTNLKPPSRPTWLRREKGRRPALRFSPAAWAKLQFMCHAGPTEIGGFAITRGDDLLYVEAFETIRQTASYVSVSFDDDAVADFFEEQIDAGYRPEQILRIWAHTHPGNSAEPSAVDEETFERVFGGCDWAIMFILARGGETYARLRFNVGPTGEIEIPVEVDYRLQFEGSDHALWEEEYERNIRALPIERPQTARTSQRKDEPSDIQTTDLDMPMGDASEFDHLLASSMGWLDPWENFS